MNSIRIFSFQGSYKLNSLEKVITILFTAFSFMKLQLSLCPLYISLLTWFFSLLFIFLPSYNLTMDSRTQTNKTLSVFALLIPHSCSLFSKDKAGYCTCSPMFWLPCLRLIPSNSLSILCFLVLNGQRQVNNQWKIMFIGLHQRAMAWSLAVK